MRNYKSKFKIVMDFSGEPLKLKLKLTQEFKDKNYNLYTVYKVTSNDEEIPLYNETFTEDQVEKFYKHPSFYLPELDEEEEDVD